jgi:hypothetical protein
VKYDSEQQPANYLVCQARFALSSSPVFTRSDTVTDSERFYNSILDLLEDPDEVKEVDDLLVWWNWFVIHVHLFRINTVLLILMISQIFPSQSQPSRPLSTHSALAKLKAKRMEIKQRAALIDNFPNES